MYKEYRVGDLFDIHPTNAYKMSNSELYTTVGTIPVVSNSSSNNGIGGYSGLAPTEKGGIITFSDTTTGGDTMFYQPNDFIGYPHVQGMYPFADEKWDEKCSLYVISVIRKAAGNGWSYAVKFNRALVRELIIELPVIENDNSDHEYTVDDIDWDYMREYIKELEDKCIKDLEDNRITEVDAYLKAARFNDYKLTEEDKNILSNNEIIFSKKLIGDLFVKVEAKCKKDDFDKRKDTSPEPNEEFCIPLINAKLGNNGIMFYGRPEDWNTQSMCMDVVQNGAVATGKVYAQPQPTAVLWDAYLIKPIQNDVSEEILLYYARCIEKLTIEKFSYEKKATWERIKKCNIIIPVTSTGEPDFDYMERYIRAIEKVVIADVVKYKDRVIEITKKVIEG